MFTGGFDTEVTITGSFKSDIYLIDNCIGAKCCISDRRGAQTTYDDLKKAMATTAVGGLLARKAGVLHIHMGRRPRRPDAGDQGPGRDRGADQEHRAHPHQPQRAVDGAGPHLGQERRRAGPDPLLYPPDFKRGTKTARRVTDLVKAGCPSSRSPSAPTPTGCTHPRLRAHGPQPHGPHVQGVPGHDQRGGHLLTDCLKCVSTNVARVLRLEQKGQIAPGMDADLLLLDPSSLEIKMVMALGVKLVGTAKLVNPPRLDV